MGGAIHPWLYLDLYLSPSYELTKCIMLQFTPYYASVSLFAFAFLNSSKD